MSRSSSASVNPIPGRSLREGPFALGTELELALAGMLELDRCTELELGCGSETGGMAGGGLTDVRGDLMELEVREFVDVGVSGMVVRCSRNSGWLSEIRRIASSRKLFVSLSVLKYVRQFRIP